MGIILSPFSYTTLKCMVSEALAILRASDYKQIFQCIVSRGGCDRRDETVPFSTLRNNDRLTCSDASLHKIAMNARFTSFVVKVYVHLWHCKKY